MLRAHGRLPLPHQACEVPLPMEAEEEGEENKVLFRHFSLLGNRVVVPLWGHCSTFAHLTHWLNKQVNRFVAAPSWGREWQFLR